MNTPDEEFFYAECIKHAQELPYQDCLRFLRGLLLIVGDPNAVADLREAVAQFIQADAQLTLFARRQLRLSLDGHGSQPGGQP